MSYNFRNRIAPLCRMPVGYQPADVACPLLVRASVSDAHRQQGPSDTRGSGGAPFPGFPATVLKPAPLRLLLTNCTVPHSAARCQCNLQGRGSSGRCDWTAAILWCTCRCCRVGLP